MATEVLTKPAEPTAKAKAVAAEPDTKEAWRGFKPGLWQRDINVRWFLQQNYNPYDGDGAFLAPATKRTLDVWNVTLRTPGGRTAQLHVLLRFAA